MLRPFIFAVLLGICLSVVQVQAKYSGGSGEPNSPYQIASVSDWNDLMYTSADWDKNFIMIADVNLQGILLTPVSNFTGVFDGNNHVIRNADINNPSGDFIGLFGIVFPGGQISNLGVENINITGDYAVGGLVGYNVGNITACYATGSVSANGTSVGGLVGENNGNITACYATDSVNGYSNVGGLAGYNYGYGTVGTISACYATGTVIGTLEYVGGLVGFNGGTTTITTCYATGAVSGSNYVGGMAGYNASTVTNCYSTGNVSGNDTTGGLCGENYYGSITNCYSTGNVTGDFYTGGLCGESYNGSITGCYSTGNVSGYDITGGLCGSGAISNDTISGSVTNCYSTGNIIGVLFTGGLCGDNTSKIINCYSTSNVSGEHCTGGLCGVSGFRGSVSNCYSTGIVSGDERVGGLCGYHYSGSITDCYSTGNVTGEANSTGGLCGYNYQGTYNNSYFLDTAGPDNGYGEPLTDAQMKQQASFINWDFSYKDGDPADWFIQIEEYPILTWQISPADIYTDGRNNFRDFAVFAQYWMREDCAIYNYYCDWADMDFDGDVDIDDLIEFMSYWLESGIYN